ncbi:DNA-directed RNA polymerase II subunit RPB1-like protein [Carex littledalei]|uniref:glutathione transferase n=1 Tax=Carex littledalei TaxID=544730 RepID=A0A833QSD0_9POAL|nr:DNA-directed RNA polymerase II subunit RPB1-like protein [Carex littledalei]
MSLPNNVSPIVKVYYGKPILPEVSRVLACLYEKEFKQVAFEYVDSTPIDLIRLQASTSVPAPFFEDGSKFLFGKTSESKFNTGSESRAICRYVSETYANRGNRYLLGHDLLDRVSIEQWLKSEEQSFDPPSRALVLQLAFPLSTKSSNDLREESERLAKVLDVYNHRLGESQYLAGDEFTLADLTHLPNSQYIATSYEWGHLFDERENLKRWWEEVSIRPSWSQAVEEIERSKEEGYQEETTEEEETNYYEITRTPSKMLLKASTFLPIEESVQ